MDLSLRDVTVDVAKAVRQSAKYLADINDQYDVRHKARKRAGMPILAFLGYGRCGKDLGAEWLGTNYQVNYAGSTSNVVNPLIAAALDMSEADSFQTRHDNRVYWYNFCNELRRNDPTLLVRMLLAKGDVVVGIRGGLELDSALNAGLIDLSLWVDRPDIAVDVTVDFDKTDCDVVILNDGTKASYFAKLRRLISTLPFTPRVPL